MSAEMDLAETVASLRAGHPGHDHFAVDTQIRSATMESAGERYTVQQRSLRTRAGRRRHAPVHRAAPMTGPIRPAEHWSIVCRTGDLHHVDGQSWSSAEAAEAAKQVLEHLISKTGAWHCEPHVVVLR